MLAEVHNPTTVEAAAARAVRRAEAADAVAARAAAITVPPHDIMARGQHPQAIYAEAERLIEEGTASTASSHGQRLHEEGQERLSKHALSVRSPALSRLIDEAIVLKECAHAAGRLHSLAEYTQRHLKTAGAARAVLDYADEVEAERDMAFQAALRDLDDIAERISVAPFVGPDDALARADCISAINGCDADGLPATDKDTVLALQSLQAAMRDLSAASKGPDFNAWDEALADYRDAGRKLEVLNRQVDEQYGDVIKWHEADPHLHAQVSAKHAEWVAAQDRLLSLQPPDAGALLTLIEIIAGHGLGGDLGSYASRQERAGETPPTYHELATRPDDIGRAVAWLAIRAAQIRDRQMPSDWRDFMASRFVHPNAADAIYRAYDHGFGLHELTNIQLVGLPEEQLPVLTFWDGSGQSYIRPDAAFSHQKVARRERFRRSD